MRWDASGRATGPSRKHSRTGALGLCLLVGLLPALGCSLSRDASSSSCGTVGRARSCSAACGGGIQQCNDDGTWSTCTCGGGSHMLGGNEDTGGTGVLTAGTNAAAGSGSGSGSGSGTSGSSGGTAGMSMLQTDADVVDLVDGSTPDGAMIPIGSDAAVETIYTPCSGNGECTTAGTTCYKSGLGGMGPGAMGYCTPSCAGMGACPQPTTGAAAATCSTSEGVCQLVCGAAMPCPLGLACIILGPVGICA